MKALNVELKVTVVRLQDRLKQMDQEYLKLKEHYKKIKEEKFKADAHNEQRISQYNHEIKETLLENEKYANEIKDLEDRIDRVIADAQSEVTRMQNAHRNEMMMLSNFKDDIQVQYDKIESSQREEEKLKAELLKNQNLLE